MINKWRGNRSLTAVYIMPCAAGVRCELKNNTQALQPSHATDAGSAMGDPCTPCAAAGHWNPLERTFSLNMQ